MNKMLLCCQMTKIDFGEWLEAELARQNMSQSDLGRRARIDKGIISRAINKERLPSPDSLSAIARGLRLPPKVVFEAAGLLPPDPETDAGFEEWAYMLSQLPERDRDELLQIARMKLERQEKEEKRKALGKSKPGAIIEP